MKSFKLLTILSLLMLFAGSAQAATTYKGVNDTLIDSVPTSKVPAYDNSRLHVLYDEFTFTAEASGFDVIQLMKIPANQRVVDVVLHLDGECGEAAAGGALSIGVDADGSTDFDNSRLFATSIECSAVGSTGVEYHMSDDYSLGGNGTTFSSEVQLVITPDELTTNAIGRTVKVWVLLSGS